MPNMGLQELLGIRVAPCNCIILSLYHWRLTILDFWECGGRSTSYPKSHPNPRDCFRDPRPILDHKPFHIEISRQRIPWSYDIGKSIKSTGSIYGKSSMFPSIFHHVSLSFQPSLTYSPAIFPAFPSHSYHKNHPFRHFPSHFPHGFTSHGTPWDPNQRPKARWPWSGWPCWCWTRRIGCWSAASRSRWGALERSLVLAMGPIGRWDGMDLPMITWYKMMLLSEWDDGMG